MDRNQVRLAMLKITLVTLLGSTWVFWSFIFAFRPEEVEKKEDRLSLTSLVRLPASLPTQMPAVFTPTVRAVEPIAMEMVRLPCWDRAEKADQGTSARWIRLTGKTCQGESDSEAVTVRNLTNGYVATVFPTRAKDMTTDFIPLQQGKNDILIRFDQGAGVSVESQFSFVRD